MNDEIQAKALRAARWINEESGAYVRSAWIVSTLTEGVSRPLSNEELIQFAIEEGWKDEEV